MSESFWGKFESNQESWATQGWSYKKAGGAGKDVFSHTMYVPRRLLDWRLVNRSGCRGSIRCSVAALGAAENKKERISSARTIWPLCPRSCPRSGDTFFYHCYLADEICVWRRSAAVSSGSCPQHPTELGRCIWVSHNFVEIYDRIKRTAI